MAAMKSAIKIVADNGDSHDSECELVHCLIGRDVRELDSLLDKLVRDPLRSDRFSFTVLPLAF